MKLTGYQVKQINEFMGGDYDFDVTVEELSERTHMDVDTGIPGETLSAGLYIWCSDYPEEGALLLPEVDPDSVGDDDPRAAAVA
jgi:hypothetical protein